MTATPVTKAGGGDRACRSRLRVAPLCGTHSTAADRVASTPECRQPGARAGRGDSWGVCAAGALLPRGRIQGEAGHHGCRRAEFSTRCVRKSNRSGPRLVAMTARDLKPLPGHTLQPRPVGRRSKQAGAQGHRQAQARADRRTTQGHRRADAEVTARRGHRPRLPTRGADVRCPLRAHRTRPRSGSAPHAPARPRSPLAGSVRSGEPSLATTSDWRPDALCRTVEGGPVQPPVQESGSGARQDGGRRRTDADAHRAACRSCRRSGPNTS